MAAIPAPDAPHPVTDLSQLAPGNALNPFGKRDQNIARKIASESDISENNVQNLGGLVSDCYISGKVKKDAGILDEQMTAILPVTITVP